MQIGTKALNIFQSLGFRKQFSIAAGLIVLVVGMVSIFQASAAGDSVNEIKYSFGNTSDSIVFDWQGAETNIYYGPDNTYGQQATASHSAITPTNGTGPFMEVQLNGLTPSATYHYKIGAGGDDHTFQTVPMGDFNWADIGDSMSTSCAGKGTWMVQQHQLIAAQQPNFVTHGGDIAVPNQCGIGSLHQYFVDQQVWSTGAAFQMAIGNHEYGSPQSGAPADAITDTLSNYKGRVFMTNAQTLPTDTATKLNHPGCGAEIKSKVNTCQGEDWGWFQTGHVLFINYPEPEQDNWASWRPQADALMANAQNDPNIDFIVTWGHRPPYTDSTEGPNMDIRNATQALAAKYSPTESNPNGKYVLDVSHHAHSMEAFKPINGLTYIIDAAGGQGLTNWVSPIDSNSVFRKMHLGILSGHYDATAHTLKVSMLCGGRIPTNDKDPCTYGTNLWSTTFTAVDTTPPPPQSVITTALNDGVTSAKVGDTLTYTLHVTNSTTGTTASGTTVSLALPAKMTITDAGGGTINSGNTINWDVGDITGGQTVTETVIATLDSGNPGDSLLADASVTATDSSCQTSGSVCEVTDIDTIPNPIKQWVLNPSFETDLTGWNTFNTSGKLTRITTDAFDGLASGRVTRTASGTGIAGLTSKTRWVSSTVAGTSYTASAYVHPQAVGQAFVMQIKEVNTAGTVIGTTTVNLTAANTSWLNLSGVRKASSSGNQLIVNVYVSNLALNAWFDADVLTLTSPN